MGNGKCQSKMVNPFQCQSGVLFMFQKLDDFNCLKSGHYTVSILNYVLFNVLKMENK